MSERGDNSVVKDSSLIPTAEQELAAVALVDGSAVEVTFPTTHKGRPAVPLILKVQADGDFYAGEDSPDATKAITHAADIIHHFPVAQRTSWFFKRVGSSTVNVRQKLYMAY